MYSELSSARARTHRAERMKDGTIGAATVGRERCSVSKEPSSNRTSNWYRIVAARRIRDDSQSRRDAFSIDCVHLQPEAALDD